MAVHAFAEPFAFHLQNKKSRPHAACTGVMRLHPLRARPFARERSCPPTTYRAVL